jgi:hypothetical protein
MSLERVVTHFIALDTPQIGRPFRMTHPRPVPVIESIPCSGDCGVHVVRLGLRNRKNNPSVKDVMTSILAFAEGAIH